MKEKKLQQIDELMKEVADMPFNQNDCLIYIRTKPDRKLISFIGGGQYEVIKALVMMAIEYPSIKETLQAAVDAIRAGEAAGKIKRDKYVN